MLEKIFISKVRFKILQTFLLNPDKTNHIRGLVRSLDEEVNAVRRELQNLESFGLIKSKKQANKLVYSLNTDFLFYSELRNMFLKDNNEIHLINKVLKNIENIEAVIITKNYINKEYIDENDIDILIVGKPNIGKLNKEMQKVEKEIGKELRMAVLTTEDFDFKRKRRDKFLLDIFENDKIILIGDSSNIGI